MLLVTGANGQLGRAVVEHLLERVPASQIAVSVREPARAADLAERGVQVRRGDFADPAGLAEAFEGVERLLLISTDVVGPARVQLHRNAVAAARQAQVGQLFYTSIVDPDPASPFSAAADHNATEQAIRESGLRHTLLRNGLYMETLLLLSQGALASGVMAAPADAPVAYATRSDLAEAAANLLAQGGHQDQALDLTGGEALDLAQVGQLLGAITGRPVERQVLHDAAYRELLAAAGMPEGGATIFLQIFAAIHQGRFATVSPALEQLLGRPPQRPTDFLRAALAGR
ncbi:MAG: NAD(P)H-binding protein [Roseiflexaceae bacterium]